MGLRRAGGILFEVLDDRAMLVSADGSELLTLNPVGSAIWAALADEQDAASLTALLAQRHPRVERDRLRRDVDAFIAELEAAGLVESS
jgi:hypothetical protein